MTQHGGDKCGSKIVLSLARRNLEGKVRLLSVPVSLLACLTALDLWPMSVPKNSCSDGSTERRKLSSGVRLEGNYKTKFKKMARCFITGLFP